MNRVEEFAQKQLDGVLDRAEEAELNALLADPAAKNTYNGMLLLDAGLRAELEPMDVSAETMQAIRLTQDGSVRKDVMHVLKTIEGGEGTYGRYWTRSRRAWLAWVGMAAALLVLAGGIYLGQQRVGDATRLCVESACPGAAVIRGETRIPVQIGMEIRNGDKVEMPRTGRMVVRYANEASMIELQADTRARFLHGGNTGKRVEMETGSMAAQVALQAGGKPMVVATPQSDATVVGTVFTILSDDISTFLDVTQGQVSLKRRPDGRTMNVAAGYLSEIGDGIDPMLRPGNAAERKKRMLVNETFRELCSSRWVFTDMEHKFVKEARFQPDGWALQLKSARPDSWGLAEIPITPRQGYYVAEWDIYIERTLSKKAGVKEGFSMLAGEDEQTRKRETPQGPDREGQQKFGFDQGQWYHWRIECSFTERNGTTVTRYKHFTNGTLRDDTTSTEIPAGVFYKTLNAEVRIANLRIAWWKSEDDFKAGAMLPGK